MTTCQNCGEDGECTEMCENCGHSIEPCGEIECPTCVEQYTVCDENLTDIPDDEVVECYLCEGPCTGMCELAQIERELSEQAIAERENRRVHKC